MQLTLTSIASARTKKAYPDTNFSSATSESFDNSNDALYVQFTEFPSAYQYKRINSLLLYAYVSTNSSITTRRIHFDANYRTWDEDTLTYNNAYGSQSYYNTVTFKTASWVSKDVKAYAKPMLTYGARLSFSAVSSGLTAALYTSRSGNKPYFVADISDSDSYQYIYSASPTSGYVDENEAITFKWLTYYIAPCVGDITVTNSKFRYRADSSSTATEIDCGTALTYTMPAETISTDSFQWQAEITDSMNHTSTTDWYTLSTVEATSTATITAPKNVVLDGSVANTFSWEHVISTGTAQTAADLQKSTDGSTWTTLGTVSGSNNYYTVAANTFTSGTYYWRVRTYNTDDTAGEWSDSASFTVISAPPMPTVSTTNEPRPTVSWQSSDQQGYQVVIEDVYDSGTQFGTATSFKLTEFLADGDYVVKVRIQNSYGLWSTYGSAPLTVSNTAGASITLTASEEDGNAYLQWTQRQSYIAFVIYRDDVAIAKTTGYNYTDRYAIGAHTYKVRGIYSQSTNYTLSNAVEVDIEIDGMMITDVESGTQLTIDLSSSAYGEATVSETATSVLTYITAADYPMIEKSRYKSKALNFVASFVRGDDNIAVFKAMLGKLVCVKTARGNMVYGSLDEVAQTETTFYIDFECIVQQIHHEETVEL